MTIRLRPFYESDYPEFAQLKNLVYPEYASPVEMFRYWDEVKESCCQSKRFLAEREGQLLGVGEFSQNPWTYHPHKFEVDFFVHPDYRRQGTGRALYQKVWQALMANSPQELHAKAREDKEGGTPYLQQMGFKEVDREWESRLEPTGFDFAPYKDLEACLAGKGIYITTLADLMDSDPYHQHKLYILDGESGTHNPEITHPHFDFYVSTLFQDPGFMPEANFIAVKNGQYIGKSSLESRAQTNEYIVGYTGVLPPFRRQGIALALKLRTIQFAQMHDNAAIVTWNNKNNQPMLALNDHLGFIRQPAWIMYRKELTNT